MTFISSTNISVPFTRSLEKTSPSQPFPCPSSFNQEVPARKAELRICTRLCGLKISSDALLKLQSRTQARRPAQLVTLSISPFAQARGEPQARVRMMHLLLPPEFSFLYQSEPRTTTIIVWLPNCCYRLCTPILRADLPHHPPPNDSPQNGYLLKYERQSLGCTRRQDALGLMTTSRTGHMLVTYFDYSTSVDAKMRHHYTFLLPISMVEVLKGKFSSKSNDADRDEHIMGQEGHSNRIGGVLGDAVGEGSEVKLEEYSSAIWYRSCSKLFIHFTD